jgi:hypothetical protein
MKISSQNQISKKELEALADIRIAEAQALMEGAIIPALIIWRAMLWSSR